MALRANVEHNHTLHQTVVIVDDLGYSDDGIFHVSARYGFQDQADVPAALALAAQIGLEHSVDLQNASYFLSKIILRQGSNGTMARWRKSLFLGMARHAANPVEYFNLPIDRTVVMGGHITV